MCTVIWPDWPWPSPPLDPPPPTPALHPQSALTRPRLSHPSPSVPQERPLDAAVSPYMDRSDPIHSVERVTNRRRASYELRLRTTSRARLVTRSQAE